MSSNKKVLQLRQSILKANTELNKIKKSGQLDTSEQANIRYNKILLQKAIDKKELDLSKESLLHKFVKKFSRKNEKLICDYFN